MDNDQALYDSMDAMVHMPVAHVAEELLARFDRAFFGDEVDSIPKATAAALISALGALL